MRRRRRGLTPEHWALLVLLALPVLMFVVPALFGHLVYPGDDRTQNYPLRILVGQQLRSGHLPLFDPYIWSGAPLLAGWNAGAAYPLTWLFAVLPGAVAWTFGLLATWWVAGIGLFVLLRAMRLSVLASVLGAIAFSFAGAMTAQMSHFGLAAGASWVPLQLLAVLRLTEPGRRRASMMAWSAVLAGTLSMTFLAGEPRAVDVAAAAVIPFALWRLTRLGRRALGPAVALVASGALGLGLGAVQLLPGLAAVATSQRAGGGVVLYSSGSMPLRWLLLLFVPDLLGGSGSLGQPSFFAPYNLTEISAYVGLLPLVAAFGLLGQLRFRRPLPEWLVWYAVAVLGALLALGTNTPAWHLFAAVPFSGAERLPSRDLMVLDLALAVLFAYWLDGWLAARRREPAEPRQRRIGLSTVMETLPALGTLSTVVVALVWGAGFLGWLGVDRSHASVDGGLKPWLVPWLVLAVLVLALIVAGPRLDVRRRSRVLAALFTVDVLLYTLLAVVAVAPGLDKHATPTRAATRSTVPSASATGSASAIGTGTVATPPAHPLSGAGSGRFAIYDPGLLGGRQLTNLGAPDGNVLSGFSSVQGYGSIEDATYAATTGTHLASGGGQDELSPIALVDGTFDQLELTVLATLSPYLLTPVPEPSGGGSVHPGPPGTGQRSVGAGGSTVWYLGPPLAVGAVSVPLDSGHADGARLGFEKADGQLQWLSTRVTSGGRALQVDLRVPMSAVALVARAGQEAVELGVPTLSYPGTSAKGTSVILRVQADGQLTDALLPPHWRYAGTDGAFVVYRNTEAAPALILEGLHGGPAPGASMRALSGPSFAPSSAAVSSPWGVEVVRSEAAVPGWTATWRPARGGTPRTLAVQRRGLVQAVALPAGAGIVTWSYRAPRFWPGLAISGSALGLVALLPVASLWLRRRGRTG